MKSKGVTGFNEQIAQWVSAATGNMWFFWAALAFIIILRVSHPPAINDLLLNVENDLQLLLLAANAVVGAKQLSVLMRVLKHIEVEEKQIEAELEKAASGDPKGENRSDAHSVPEEREFKSTT